VPDRCPRRAGSHKRSTARRWLRVWPVRRGSGDNPTADSPSPVGGDPGDAPYGRRAAGPAARTGVVLPRGQSAVPGQQRRGCHREDPGPLPARDKRGQYSEPGPVGVLVTDRAGGPAQHRVLMPEHQQLGVLRLVPAEHQRNQAEQPAHQQVSDLQRHPNSQSSQHQAYSRNSRSSPRSSIRAAQGAAGHDASRNSGGSSRWTARRYAARPAAGNPVITCWPPSIMLMVLSWARWRWGRRRTRSRCSPSCWTAQTSPERSSRLMRCTPGAGTPPTWPGAARISCSPSSVTSLASLDASRRASTIRQPSRRLVSR